MDPRAEVLASGGAAPPGDRAAPARRRAEVVLIGGLLVLTGLAWLETARRMAGMDAGPGAYQRVVGPFLSTWVVMMAAMMFPAIALAVTAAADAKVGPADPSVRATVAVRLGAATVLLIAGYLAVWSLAGAVGYGILRSGRALAGGFLEWDRAGRGVVVAVLVIAAAYQFTSAKLNSLGHCSRLGRPSTGSSRRVRAALREGVELGAWCVACSWALMAALFALGAMSLRWMALIAVLVTAERVMARPAILRVFVAVVVAALAIGVALGPTHVPGLTIPGNGPAMPTMQGAAGGLPLDTVPAWSDR